jgi:hypothetical protein
VLGADSGVAVRGEEACVSLDEGRQTLRFVPTGAGAPGRLLGGVAGRPPGITEVAVAVDGWDADAPGALEVCGVRFVVQPVGGHGRA